MWPLCIITTAMIHQSSAHTALQTNCLIRKYNTSDNSTTQIIVEVVHKWFTVIATHTVSYNGFWGDFPLLSILLAIFSLG